MAAVRRGLSKAARKMKLSKPMRSRISDRLTPPPAPTAAQVRKEVEPIFDPKVIAEKIWMVFMSDDTEGEGGDFEAKFFLKDKRGFAIRGDKEAFGTIQAMEPFDEVHERLLETYNAEICTIEIISDDRSVTFSSYGDFIEWLELD